MWGLLSVVSRQPSGVTAQLVAAKGRLAKRDLTIPRLELIGAHMASNLLANVKAAWLTNHDLWPPNPVLQPSPESEAELKPIRRVLRMAVEPSVREPLERILETYSLRKTLRIGAWFWRFATIFRGSLNSMRNPLTTQELLSEETRWVKRVQSRITAYEREQVSHLGLTENTDSLLECRGRIIGKYSYLPHKALFTEKLVQRAHLQTL